MVPTGNGRGRFKQEQVPYKYVGAGAEEEPQVAASPNYCVIATGVCALGFALGFTVWLLCHQTPPVVAASGNPAAFDKVGSPSGGSTWSLNPAPAAASARANGVGTPPSTYHTLEAYWRQNSENTNDVSKTVATHGPEFSAYVYLENAEPLYDKRVIFAAYVQTIKEGCTEPTACDGQKGGSEFDLIETGFVGFNSRTVENNIDFCESRCGGRNCSSQFGAPGCTWDKPPNKITCQIGDAKECNNIKSKEQIKSKDCTWTDVQSSISFCTQKAYLDPRSQDFTQLAANGYLHGKTGKAAWSSKGSAGTATQNDQTAWSVETPDSVRWGNRWIKINLKLVGNDAVYTYHFFRPGPVSDVYVPVVGARSLTLMGHSPTFDAAVPHAWVFSLWQYDFWGAVSSRPITDGMRRLHFSVDGGTVGPKSISGGSHVGFTPIGV